MSPGHLAGAHRQQRMLSSSARATDTSDVVAPTPRLRVLGAVALGVVVAACQTGSSTEPSTAPPASAHASVQTGCSVTHPNQPGTYNLTAQDTFTIPATVTLAEGGWKGCGLLTKEYGSPAGLALIGFWHVENVYSDPCHWMGTLFDPPVGPSPEDLTAALVDQELTEASTPTAAALDGNPASFVTVLVPVDLDTSNCDAVVNGEFRFWKDIGEELTGSAVWWVGAADAPGLIGEVWAADIQDARVVVNAAYYADADQAERDEIHAIIQSITFPP